MDDNDIDRARRSKVMMHRICGDNKLYVPSINSSMCSLQLLLDIADGRCFCLKLEDIRVDRPKFKPTEAELKGYLI